MNELKNTVSQKDIREIVRQVVERFRPQKVILFGSYAQGKPTPDSDVDLLVIMDTEEKPVHAAARISTNIDHPFPLDVLVMSPEEFEETKAVVGGLAYPAHHWGKVLYEANP
jgi:predicted nucleotidyltransferase